MSRENILRKQVESLFTDWPDEFDVDIQADDFFDDIEAFDVIIQHNLIGHAVCFCSQVTGEGHCSFVNGDGDEFAITRENVFISMWFSEAQKHET